MGKPRQRNIIIETPELKEQLRELALVDFDKFLELFAIDGIQVYVCSQRGKSQSFQQIATRLKAKGIEITRQSVSERCKKCQE